MNWQRTRACFNLHRKRRASPLPCHFGLPFSQNPAPPIGSYLGIRTRLCHWGHGLTTRNGVRGRKRLCACAGVGSRAGDCASGPPGCFHKGKWPAAGDLGFALRRGFNGPGRQRSREEWRAHHLLSPEWRRPGNAAPAHSRLFQSRTAAPRRVLHIEYADSLDLKPGIRLAVA